MCAFCTYLKNRAHPSKIVYDHVDAKRRICDAVFMDEDDCLDRVERADEIYGETDGDQIWINPWCTGREMMLTLVHEALHDSVHVVRPTRSGRKKGLYTAQEHAVMDTFDFCI
jgi:hypothetical protein